MRSNIFGNIITNTIGIKVKSTKERTIESDKMRWWDFQIDNKKIVENEQTTKINRK